MQEARKRFAVYQRVPKNTEAGLKLSGELDNVFTAYVRSIEALEAALQKQSAEGLSLIHIFCAWRRGHAGNTALFTINNPSYSHCFESSKPEGEIRCEVWLACRIEDGRPHATGDDRAVLAVVGAESLVRSCWCGVVGVPRPDRAENEKGRRR